MYYYDIALVHAVLDYDEIYTYASKEKIAPGSLVEVPFGVKNIPKEGVILKEVEDPSFKTKDILRIIEPEILTREQLQLLIWMHQRYFAGFFQLLRFFVPSGVRGVHKKELRFKRKPSTPKEDKLIEDYLGGKEEALKELMELGLIEESYRYEPKVKGKLQQMIHPGKNADDLRDALDHWPSRRKVQQEILHRLSEGEILEKNARYNDSQLKELLEGGYVLIKEKTPFNGEDEFSENIKDEIPNHSVLFAHPREALFKLIPSIKAALDQGQVLIIVPKAFLLPFLEKVLHDEGIIRTLSLYPEMSMKKKKEAYHWIKDGEVKVVLGTRNALFTQMNKLSAMILLSCNDENYQTEMPTFDVVDCFIKRGEIEGAKVYLSASSFPLALTGRGCKGLDFRSEKAVDVIDMTLEGANLLSEKALDELSDTLDKNQKSLIYLNQLGMASVVICQGCGEVVKCPSCHRAMSYHREDNHYHCHYCHRSERYTSSCRVCGGNRLKLLGGGIEKVASLLEKRFPDARILTLTADSFSTKTNRNKVIKLLEQKNYDIILGTRLMTQQPESDFSIVIVVSPDTVAFSPNYNGIEKTYHLLHDLTSNLNEEGHLLIQTFKPEAIVYNQGFDEESDFLKRELLLRKEDRWPPYVDLYRVEMSSKDKKHVWKAQEALKDKIKSFEHVECFGPMEPVRATIKNRHFCHLIIKAKKGHEELEEFLHEFRAKGDIQVRTELNPSRIL